MPRFIHLPHSFWLPLLLALASVALWNWSNQLPATPWDAPATGASPTIQPPLISQPGQSPAPQATQNTPETGAPSQTAATAELTPAPTASAPPASTPAATPSATSSPQPTPTPQPPPSDAELAGPLPRHTKEELKTRASAPPTAANPRLGLAQIASNPRLWPKQVVLVAPVRFTVIVNGAAAGSLQMPRGRAVTLRSLSPDGTVLLELPGAPGTQAKTKAQATDLVARAWMIANALKQTPAPR